MGAVVDVVLPVFGIILLGWIAGRRGWLGPASSEALNLFVYWIALPVLLFHALARVRPEQALDLAFLAAVLGAAIVVLVVATALAMLVFGRRLADASLFGMAAAFGNTGYMGIPLAIAAFGEPAALAAAVATVFVSAVLIAGATVGVEIGLAGGEGSRRAVLADLAHVLGRNPLLVASALGMAWSLTGVALPTPLDRLCGLLGSAAGPCALFSIGLFLVGKPVHGAFAETAAIVVLKLVAMPVLTAWLAWSVFDVRPDWAMVAVLLAALPTGANAFVLAQRYNVHVERVSAAIFWSTLAAVPTLSVLFATRALWRD